MKINLTDDTPFHCAPRRLSYSEKAEVQAIIDKLLSEGVVRYSNSPYASATVLVRKKSGEGRLCIDYRFLKKKNNSGQFSNAIDRRLLRVFVR